MKQSGEYCVMVVDDHHMMRLGLKTFASVTGKFAIRWLEASNLADALALYLKHASIDLVLLDLNLPDSQGLQSVQRFLVEFPDARLVVHSATEDEFVVRQALTMGVIGFIPKSVSADSMLTLLESMLANALLPHDFKTGTKPSQHNTAGLGYLQSREGLTPTQLRVLEFVLAGLSNQEIAAECNLALGTVKNTVSSIMLVLNVNSRSHLISLFK